MGTVLEDLTQFGPKHLVVAEPIEFRLQVQFSLAQADARSAVRDRSKRHDPLVDCQGGGFAVTGRKHLRQDPK